MKTQNSVCIFVDEMPPPQLLQMSMQQLHHHGRLPSFLRRMMADPYEDDEVPELTRNGSVIIE